MPDDVIPAANEYDEAVRELAGERDQSLNHSFVAAAATGMAPEQQARVLDLSRRHNLPADIVARNLPDIERQDSENPPELADLPTRAPGLSRWLEDPQNAALAKDDLEPLARIDRGTTAALAREKKPAAVTFAVEMGRAALTGWTDLHASAWNMAAMYGLQDPYEAAEKIAAANKRSAELRAKAPDYAQEFSTAMQAEGGDVNRAWKRFTGSYEKAKDGHILEALKDYHLGGATTIGQALDMIGAAVIRPRGVMHSGAENLAFSAPALALTYAGAAAGAATGPLAPVAVPVGMASGAFVGSVGAEIGAWMSQAMAKRPGFDPTNPEHIAAAFADPAFMAEARGEAERKGITTAAVDAAFAAFGGKILGKAAGAGKAAKAGAAAADVAVQAVGETVSEAAGQGAAKKSIKGIDIGDSILEGIVSLGHSVGDTTIGHAYDRARYHATTTIAAQEVAQHAQDAQAAQKAAQGLADVGNAIEEAKTTKRLPEAIRQVVAAAAEGNDDSTVYFQTEAWDEYWQGQGLSPAKAAGDLMGDGGRAYSEAKAQGHQLEVGVADYIGKMALTEHYKGLLPTARMQPDGMSLAEATDFLKGLPGLMDELAGEAVGKGTMATPEEKAAKESSAKVKTAVTDMLVAAKTPRPEAERLGQLWQRHMVARAERLGTDPYSLFQKMGLEITRPTEKAPIDPQAVVEALASGDLQGIAKALTPQDVPVAESDAADAEGDTSFDFGENMADAAAVGSNDPAYAEFLRDEAQLNELEYLQNNGGLTPILDGIRANGGLSMKKLEQMGRMQELQDLHWTQIFTTDGKTLDGMAEALAQDQEGGPKLKERDINLLVESIREEAAKISAYKAKYGDKAYQYLRRTLRQDEIKKAGDASEDGKPSRSEHPAPGEGAGQSQASEQAPALSSFLDSLDKSLTGKAPNFKSLFGETPLTGTAEMLREELRGIVAKGKTKKQAIAQRLKDLDGTTAVLVGGAAEVAAGPYPAKIKATILGNLTREAERRLMLKGEQPTAEVIAAHEALRAAVNARTLEQGEKPNAPTFFSKLARIIAQKMGKSATVEQVTAIAKEAKGEELKWSGLVEFLRGKTKVTREELMAHLSANELQIQEKVLGGDQAVRVTQGLQDREIDMASLTPEQKKAHATLLAAGFDIAVPPEGDMPNANEVHFVDLGTGDILDRVMLADELTRQSHMDYTDENGEINLRRMTADEAAAYEGDQGYDNVAEGAWAMIPVDDSEPIPIAEADVSEDAAREMAMERVKDVGVITYKGKQHAIQDILDAADKFGPGKDESKFGSYVLPGGANYREVLFTLPERSVKQDTLPEGYSIKELHDPEARERNRAAFTLVDPDGSGTILYNAMRRETAEADAIDVLRRRGVLPRVDSDNFRSTHFEQPNIFAHTRLTDRVVNGKRVLFIEEIQSDWHQKGRDQGYKGALPPLTELPAEFKVVKEKDNSGEYYSVIGPSINTRNDTIEWGTGATVGQAREQALETINQQRARDMRDAVPDAPFRKTWHEYALKRILRMAAEQGYDSIAWTTGEQQVERYKNALQSKVDKIVWKKTEQGVHLVGFKGEGSRTSQVLDTTEKETALSDAIGKAMAQQIIASPEQSGTIEGDDITISNTGMAGFYDGIVPQFLSKFTKKYEAKVGEITLPSAASGVDPYETENHQAPKEGPAQVHSLDLTPALKTAALEQGFELFQKDQPTGEARARVTFLQDKKIIELLKKADRTSMLHEGGHIWLEGLADDAETVAAIPEASRTAGQRAILEDWNQTLAWLGVKDRNGIKTKQHEQWARGIEAYLFEGKAPSAQLRAAFRRFKAWLLKAYGDINALQVELSPEIRGVFDRLVATKQEIAEAQAEMQHAPLFTDPASAGLDTKAMEGYMAAVEESKAAAEEELGAKVLERVRREEEAWWKEERAAVRADIAADMAQRPEQIALAALQSERMPDGQEYPEGTLPPKLDRAAIPPDVLATLPRGVTTAQDGAHPDVLAGIFGYQNGGELLLALQNTLPFKQVVETTTDEIMASRHGDVLRDVEALQDQAMKAIHTEHHAEVLRAEISHLASNHFAAFKGLAKKIAGRVPTLEAARMEAGKAIGRRKVSEIRPGLFKVAEAKAAREARDLFLAGDIQGAFDAKRRQLANHELYRAAAIAKEQIDRALDRFKRMSRKDEKLAKTRDVDLINAARSILASFGLDRTEKPASEYLAQLKSFDPEMYETVNELVMAATHSAAPWRDISVDDFSAMAESVQALWDLSLRTQQIRIDGIVMEKKDAVEALGKRLEEIGLPSALPGYKRALTKWEKVQMHLLGARAALRRVESWVDAADESSPAGVFRKYLWTPIAEATADYRIEKRTVLTKYLALLDQLKGTLHHQDIAAPEIGYTFSGKAELLHAMLHTGNESNFSKLLRGRGWGDYDAMGELDASKWNAMIKRMSAPYATGTTILTKADYDFLQATWDLLETLKPAAQTAHKEMYGYYFGEVSAQPFTTPYGVYAGGYVPAITDPYIVREADIRNEREALEKSNNSFMFPTAGRGFTKKRVEGYAKPLLLDLGLLASHIDKVLRFTYIEPRVKDVGRIVMSRDFRAKLDAFDPAVGGDMLVPWLQRAAQQNISTPSRGLGGRALDKFFSELRRRTGLQIMAANVSNTFQQFTGIAIGAVKVKPKHLRNALWTYVHAPKQTTADIAAKSKFMDTRVTTSTFEVQHQLEDLLLDPTKFEQARAFAQQHAYILQSGAQSIVDTVVWAGAYEQSVEGGADEKAAVREADAAVRATQGSFNPEDVSRFETGSPMARAFTMFYSYFNMQANLLGSEFSNVQRAGGLKKGAGRALYVYTMGFMIPAFISELITRAMSGKLDEDDDDQVLDDVAGSFFWGQMRTATAMFPIVGPTINAGINAWNDKWYDDRITTSPAVAMIESSVQAPRSVYKAIFDDGSKKKAARDFLTLIGLLTAVPLAPAARPIGYLADLSEGNIEQPTGPIDLARGLVTGRGARR